MRTAWNERKFNSGGFFKIAFTRRDFGVRMVKDQFMGVFQMKSPCLSILLFLTILPCAAEENVSKPRFHQGTTTQKHTNCFMTFVGVCAGEELTAANTIAFEKTRGSADANEVTTLDFAQHPKAIHNLALGSAIQLTDFYYPGNLTARGAYVEIFNTPSMTPQLQFPPDVITPSLNAPTNARFGDFEKTSQKNVYDPQIEHGMYEIGPEGFFPATNPSSSNNPLNEWIKRSD